MAETVLNPQEEQQHKIAPKADAKSQGIFLRRVIGLILSAIMIALSAYVLYQQNENHKVMLSINEMQASSSAAMATNYRTYVTKYTETKIQLEETTRRLELVKKQLDDVTAELETTRGMLNETQSLLNQAQSENVRLKDEIQTIDTLRASENVNSVSELEAKIGSLKQQNAQVTDELANVKNELKAYEANFSTIPEGSSLIALFKNKIQLVKSRMRAINQEAYFARMAAQKEKDRIELLNGNNGFFVKDGQAVKTGNAKGFAIDVKIVP